MLAILESVQGGKRMAEKMEYSKDYRSIVDLLVNYMVRQVFVIRENTFSGAVCST